MFFHLQSLIGLVAYCYPVSNSLHLHLHRREVICTWLQICELKVRHSVFLDTTGQGNVRKDTLIVEMIFFTIDCVIQSWNKKMDADER